MIERMRPIDETDDELTRRLRRAGIGQIGAGLVQPPMECFEQALLALAEAYDAPDEPAAETERPA